MMRLMLAAIAFCLATAADRQGGAAAVPEAPDARLFFAAASPDVKIAEAALESIAASWNDGYAPMFVDIVRFLPSQRSASGRESTTGESQSSGSESPFARLPEAPPPVDPRARVRERLVRFLEKQTGQRFGDDLNRWRQWIWNLPYAPHPDYAQFKGNLYATIDPRMGRFFSAGMKSLIRLDEVDWGGVKVDGIPPLDHPRNVTAAEAEYVGRDSIVFGIELNGEARAYPKRIIAWHELLRDRIGGTEVTLVYCTLCGAVVAYASEAQGIVRRFGTSGLLYRSNKLMYDAETYSLWSSLEGKPVIGPLAGSGIVLDSYPVVTTTWSEWKAQNPSTRVLSIDTGFKRDYSEGAAYRDYFASDKLMFQVPGSDSRLGHKDEVLVMRPDAARSDITKPLAISVEFLKMHPIFQIRWGGREIVVLTSEHGANRVYDAGGIRFLRDAGGGLVDSTGIFWRMEESSLISQEPHPRHLPRIAAHRAFWFGWRAQHPDTDLVK